MSRDFRGEPEHALAPEMPTRFAKQLVSVYRGARIIGLDDATARMIVRRLTHDSFPPSRRRALLAVHDAADGATSKEVSEQTGISRTVADRVLRELALHGLVRHSEREYADELGRHRVRWVWHPAAEVDLRILRAGFGHGPSATAGEGEEGAAPAGETNDSDVGSGNVGRGKAPPREGSETDSGNVGHASAESEPRKTPGSPTYSHPSPHGGINPERMSDGTGPAPPAGCSVRGCPRGGSQSATHMASGRTFAVCPSHADVAAYSVAGGERRSP